MEKYWYVVHTYSGFENKVMQSIMQRKKKYQELNELIEDVFIPTENVVELKQGKRQERTKKFFPGYILVKMVMNNETWRFIKETPRVSGFIGFSEPENAVPLKEEEVTGIFTRMKEGVIKTEQTTVCQRGDSVQIIDGPFVNFNGIIDEVNKDKSTVKVMVSIFGRMTPVELEFSQIEKV
jgi:transcription termination/antitermination protein NusG